MTLKEFFKSFRTIVILAIILIVGGNLFLNYHKNKVKKNQQKNQSEEAAEPDNCQLDKIEDFSSFMGIQSHNSVEQIIQRFGEPDKQTQDSTGIVLTYISEYRTAISMSFSPKTKTISSVIIYAGGNRTSSDLDLRIYGLKKLEFLNRCEISFLGTRHEEVSKIFGDYHYTSLAATAEETPEVKDKDDLTESPKVPRNSMGYMTKDKQTVVLFSFDPEQENRCNALKVSWIKTTTDQKEDNISS